MGCKSKALNGHFQPSFLADKESQKRVSQLITEHLKLTSFLMSDEAFMTSSEISIDSPLIVINGTQTDTRTGSSMKVKLLKANNTCYLKFGDGDPIVINNIKCAK